MKQVMRLSSNLKKNLKKKFTLRGYLHDLSKVGEPSPKILRKTKYFKQHKSFNGKKSMIISSRSKKDFVSTKKYKKRINKSFNGQFGKNEAVNVKQTILTKEFLEQLYNNRNLKTKKQREIHMLGKELDLFEKSLKTNIKMKKNNMGYPRIKLSVFLDQIKQ